MLVGQGVSEVDAQRDGCSIVKAPKCDNDKSVCVYELHGQGGLTKAARRFRGLNLEGLQVLDLRGLRPDGEAWDFSRKKDRQWVLRLIQEQRPMWIIGAPPCTYFSTLHPGSKDCKRDQTHPANAFNIIFNVCTLLTLA